MGMGLPGLFELLILGGIAVAVAAGPVALAVYFAWWRPRSRRTRGFDVRPPDRGDEP
jgi:hypothetical protein